MIIAEGRFIFFVTMGKSQLKDRRIDKCKKNNTKVIKHTVMTPSSRPESGLGGSCLSIDHFSTIDATWGLSTLRMRKPVMLTPQKRYGSRSMAIRSFWETTLTKDGVSFSLPALSVFVSIICPGCFLFTLKKNGAAADLRDTILRPKRVKWSSFQCQISSFKCRVWTSVVVVN